MVAAATSPFGQIFYDPLTGRYRSEFGGFLSEEDVRSLVDQEQVALDRKLQAATLLLLAGSITIAQWERMIAQELKLSHIRITDLAAGGSESIRRSPDSSRYWRQVGRNLRDEYVKLAVFAAAIAAGEKTEGQIKAWIAYKSNSVYAAFSRAEVLTRLIQQGANEAMRSLDPTSLHCPDCPNYSTGGLFVPIDQIIPVGHACVCNGRCRCRIIFRFNPRRLLDLI